MPFLRNWAQTLTLKTREACAQPCRLTSFRSSRSSASTAIKEIPAPSTNQSADEIEREPGELNGLIENNARVRSARKVMEFASQYVKDARAGNVYLLYQPIVYTQTGELSMIEGLVRWNDSRTNTQRTAPEVLHAAALSQSLHDLTRITLRRGISDLVKLHAAGLNKVGLAINLNPEQLADRQLVGYVREVLAAARVNPGFLTLEVTEEAILHDEELVFEQLSALSELGVSLAIDDFGVGYSSLARLQRLPFDSIKIDKIFLENVPDNVRRAQFFTAIVNFSKAVGIDPIAEGVETEVQRSFVKSSGCHMLQGFVESAPLPLNSLLADYAPLEVATA